MDPVFHQLLDNDETVKVVETILKLKPYWSYKDKRNVLCTLGEALYQNRHNMSLYYASVDRLNPILWDNFSWVYIRLLKTLSHHLQEPIYYSQEISLPGFHIFCFETVQDYQGGGAHFDLQYQNLIWANDVVVSVERAISFTLAVELPSNGAGIDIWDLTYEDYMSSRSRIVGVNPNELANSRQHTYYTYTVGQLMIFESQYWHAIGKIGNLQQSDRRITLQGHALNVDSKWIAYW